MASREKDTEISSAARAMGKKRWAGLSEEERKTAMEKARAARQRKLSKARRLEIARAAAKARWAKAREGKQKLASEAEAGKRGSKGVYQKG